MKRAVEADIAKQKEFGAKGHYPSAAHLALAQMGVIVAGEIAGTWGEFGGAGAQVFNLAQIVEVAM